MMVTAYGGLGPEFWKRRPLIGMVHLGALPGSPDPEARPLKEVMERVTADAQALERGGANALIVENFFDAPFPKDGSPPHTVAAMTLAVARVREAVALPVGVNVLRNDALTALAIAHICAAQFVRINVYVGAAVTDQGLIEGAARSAVLYRRQLGADVAIWADVWVKHATQLGGGLIEEAARDAVHRGMADALIVSGASTGSLTDPEEVRRVREAVPDTPVLVGSGFNPDSAASLMKWASGAIAGTSLKVDGLLRNPVDENRVRELRRVMG